MLKNIEIISLIYKSTVYLNYIVKQLKSEFCKAEGWDVGIRVVANDATENVLEALKNVGIPYTIFNNPDKNEYYINRVYRCYNYCAITSEYDNICLINSDNGFSGGWLSNLLRHHDGINIPCSRLVESGKMLSGMYGISNNFGRTCSEFELRFNDWLLWADQHREDRIACGGLYMPGIFEKHRFIESGMYPEGNIYSDGRVLRSADEFYFHDILEKKFGMKHVTVFDSMVYHIQEGEKDE